MFCSWPPGGHSALSAEGNGRWVTGPGNSFLQSCDSTHGSHRGSRVGVRLRGLEESETGTSLGHKSRPGGSSICFLLQLIFYISFRLSSMSQARRQEVPVGRLHFRARLQREHRVTPLMKGRDGLASLGARGGGASFP